jgi:hypothetical protein
MDDVQSYGADVPILHGAIAQHIGQEYHAGCGFLRTCKIRRLQAHAKSETELSVACILARICDVH